VPCEDCSAGVVFFGVPVVLTDVAWFVEPAESVLGGVPNVTVAVICKVEIAVLVVANVLVVADVSVVAEVSVVADVSVVANVSVVVEAVAAASRWARIVWSRVSVQK
jgi:hypothetical protein